MSESVTFSFKIDKHSEFLKASRCFSFACRGLTLTGAIFGVCSAAAAVVAVVEYFEDTIEYDARIVESQADVFGRDNGLPLEWAVTYERIPSQQRWNAKVYKNDKHNVGDVVRIVENKKGQRRLKHGGSWVVALACGVFAAGLLWAGIGGHVPEWAYWPPSAQLYM